MPAGIKLNHADYVKALNRTNKETGNQIKPIDTYVKMTEKLLHKCNKCEHEWSVKPANVLHRKSGCPKCNMGAKPKVLLDHLLPVKKALNKKWKILSDINALTPNMVEVKCKECKTHRFYKVAYLKKIPVCAICASNTKKTTESFVNELKAKFNTKKIDFSKVDYHNSHTKVRLVCAKHGDFDAIPNSLLAEKRKYICPYCSRLAQTKKTRLTQKQFLEKANRLHPEKYTYEKTKYKHSHREIKITCKEHGDFTLMPYNFLSNNLSGCPRCSQKVSQPHEKILKALDKLNVSYEVNKKVFGNYEADIWIESHNVAIEINGIYWHSVAHKDKNYHAHKAKLAQDKNIKLLQFWDTEIDNNFDLVLSMIKHSLMLSKKRYARKYKINYTPDKCKVKHFLNKSHLQGYCSYSSAITLEKNNKIYAVATFRKPRFNKNYDAELIRLAIKKNYSIMGAPSKLITNYVRRTHNSVISYANKLYSEGNVYEKIGFDFIRTTQPNYVWIKKDIQLSRYKTQKSKLSKLLPNFDSTKSESENMILAGFTKVYDAGNEVFALKIKN